MSFFGDRSYQFLNYILLSFLPLIILFIFYNYTFSLYFIFLSTSNLGYSSILSLKKWLNFSFYLYSEFSHFWTQYPKVTGWLQTSVSLLSMLTYEGYSEKDICPFKYQKLPSVVFSRGDPQRIDKGGIIWKDKKQRHQNVWRTL